MLYIISIHKEVDTIQKKKNVELKNISVLGIL